MCKRYTFRTLQLWKAHQLRKQVSSAVHDIYFQWCRTLQLCRTSFVGPAKVCQLFYQLTRPRQLNCPTIERTCYLNQLKATTDCCCSYLANDLPTLILSLSKHCHNQLCKVQQYVQYVVLQCPRCEHVVFIPLPIVAESLSIRMFWFIHPHCMKCER